MTRAFNSVPLGCGHLKLEKLMGFRHASHYECFVAVGDECGAHVLGDEHHVLVANGRYECLVQAQGVLGFLVHSKCVVVSRCMYHFWGVFHFQ